MRLANLGGVAHYVPHAHHVHIFDATLSRRRFLTGAAAAGAVIAAGSALRPTAAYAHTLREQTRSASGLAPRPIPSGLTGDLFGDPNNHHLYHVLPPVPPGADGQPGQYTECSTITDFHGLLGAANVNGHGTGTPTKSNPEGRYDFNVDMRFMHGAYIGVDGRQHHGTFGFV
jgi:hypothetical protein